MRFSHSKKNGTSYNCRRIELEPKGCMDALLKDIGRAHLERPGGRLLKYEDVREYDGTCDVKTVYRISDGNPELKIDLDGLFKGIADPDSETDPFEMKAQAYILCGRLDIDGESRQVKLISMNTPVTALKNKFLFDKGKFMELLKKEENRKTAADSFDIPLTGDKKQFVTCTKEASEKLVKVLCGKAMWDILPLAAFDFTLWLEALEFLIFFLAFGFLCIRHNFFCVNIVLELGHYRVYECRLINDDGVCVEKTVISRKTLNMDKGQNIRVKVINNEFLLDTGK